MASNRLVGIFLLIIVAMLLVVPVSATTVSNVQYASEVYSEAANYIPNEISQPPAKIPDSGIVSSTTIQTNPYQQFQRYALVSMPGSGVDISFTLDSDGAAYNSDLVGLVVTQNEVPVTTGTLTSGKIRVKGEIFSKTSLDKPVKIFELKSEPGNVNNQFVVQITTKERAAARNSIYLLNEKILAGGSDNLKPDLQNAMDSYTSGNFILAKTYAESGLGKSSIQTDKSSQGNIQTIIVAIIFGLLCFGLGLWLGNNRGKKAATKPDLLKIEQVIQKYYGMRSENPFSPVKISAECDAVLQRAFDFNAKRAEMLKSQKDQHVGKVDPDRLTSSDLRPSLFQALYEKTRYGRCNAFDAGITYLNKCLNENESKR